MFCGAGGFTLGAKASGAEVVLGVDGWEPAIATQIAAGHHAYLSKIEVINKATAWQRQGGQKSLEAWRRVTSRGPRYHQYGWFGPSWDDLVNSEVDIVIGGPPCQPFSVSGKQRGEHDSRDGYPAAIQAIRHLKPTFCVLENVMGILQEKHSQYLNWVLSELRSIFNYVDVWRLNAADFGVPQHRRRVFFVGSPRPITPPKPTHAKPGEEITLFGSLEPWVSMRTALGLPDKVGAAITGSHASGRPQFELTHDEPSPAILASYGDGGSNWVRSGYPWLFDRPAPTVCAGHVCGISTNTHRTKIINQELGRWRLTPSECAKLQGFPDDYPWPERDVDAYRCIGNAVPPGLARAVIETLLKSHKPD